MTLPLQESESDSKLGNVELVVFAKERKLAEEIEESLHQAHGLVLLVLQVLDLLASQIEFVDQEVPDCLADELFLLLIQ